MTEQNDKKQVTHPQPPSTEIREDTDHTIPPSGEPREALNKVVDGSNEIIFTASTVFPLTLFPDTITIDRSKITLTRRTFFRMAEVMTIRIEDVLNVAANVGPFFGSVKITNRVVGTTEEPYHIEKFWRDDALKFKRIIQGYIIVIKRRIDCSELSVKELRDKLDKLGEDPDAEV